jgi:hypothetical protein
MRLRLVYSSRVDERFEGELDLEQQASSDRRVSVVIDERGLVLGDRIECARDRFLGGAFEDLGTHHRVLVVAKEDRGTSEFWFFKAPDGEIARAMLRAASLDAEHAALDVQSSGRRWTSTALLVPFVLVIFQLAALLLVQPTYGLAELLVLAFVAYGLSVFAPRVGRIELKIGNDGIFRRHLREKQFIPFTRIRQVWSIGSRVAIQLVDGSVVDLKFAGTSPVETNPRVSPDYAMVQLIKMRVLDGIRRAAASIEVFHQDFEIARGARELHAWLGELRKKRVALADYRTAPRPEIDIDAVLGDSALDGQTRAGAAIALRARDGDDAESRLRAAASTTASPELRMALEKIADGSFDDELEERLQKLR